MMLSRIDPWLPYAGQGCQRSRGLSPSRRCYSPHIHLRLNRRQNRDNYSPTRAKNSVRVRTNKRFIAPDQRCYMGCKRTASVRVQTGRLCSLMRGCTINTHWKFCTFKKNFIGLVRLGLKLRPTRCPHRRSSLMVNKKPRGEVCCAKLSESHIKA